MIGRLNHVAIAVRDIAKASELYRETLGAEVSAAVPQPEHGVTTVFITLPNTKIELLEPLGESSPIAKFLERNPDGGIHHVCYEVDDILAARDTLKARGRARARRRRAEDRRARQAGAVPAPEGFLRHAGRARAGLMALIDRDRDLLPDLVADAVRRAAVGRGRAGRGGWTPGTDPGAPRVHNVARKLIWTTHRRDRHLRGAGVSSTSIGWSRSTISRPGWACRARLKKMSRANALLASLNSDP